MNIHPHCFRFLCSLLIAVVCLPMAAANAADEDFKAGTFDFKVHRYTDATKAALEAQGEKRVVRVDIMEECSMEDFAKVCDHAWIKKIQLYRGTSLVTSFEPLAKLTALEELDAQNLKASHEAPFDLAPLAGLENLEKLFLGATKSKNFASLSGLKKLESLELRMTGVDSLAFLSDASSLEKLDVYGKDNTFPDYAPLAGAKNLKMLVIDGNVQATDENLAVLSSLTQLESMSMKDCSKVTSLNFLKGSAATLERLTIVECSALTDVAALNEMTSLEWLLANGLPTEDLSFLSKMPELTTLNLLGVKVADLAVFSGLSKLKTLYLTSDLLPEGAEEKLAEMLPEAKFRIK